MICVVVAVIVVLVASAPLVRSTITSLLENQNTKQKEEKKTISYYALTGLSWAIFMMKKNPRASITVRTESA